MKTDNDFYDNYFLSDLAFNTDFSITNLFLKDSTFFNNFNASFSFEDDSWDSSDFDY